MAGSAKKHHSSNVTKLFVSVPGPARLLVQGACGFYWLSCQYLLKSEIIPWDACGRPR